MTACPDPPHPASFAGWGVSFFPLHPAPETFFLNGMEDENSSAGLF